jgi:hypothetical protein
MGAIAYTVVATLPDEKTASEYVDWLGAGHVDAVVKGGANSGVIVRIEEPGSPIQVESRYVFPNRGAFERYVKETAPGLRAEGLQRFGPERGIRFERRVGVVL